MIEYNNKTKEFIFKVPKQKYKGLLSKEFNKKMNEEIKVTRKHFKEDGWDLDFYSMYHRLLDEVLGDNLMDVFMSKIVHQIDEVKLSVNKDGFFIKLKDYNPVSYDNKLNKILVGEFKDTVDGRYTYLGPL